MSPNIYGWIGMIMVQGCTLPQIIKAIRTKNVTGVSWLFWIILTLGLTCYLIYAFKINALVYKVSNITGISFNLIMLYLLFRYKKK